MKGKIFIGTSGWMYKAWHDKFYPPDERNYLSYYSHHFQTVEINNSFYRLPAAKTFATWRSEVGDGFIFSVKLSRAITHIKRLKEAGDYVENFLLNYSYLAEKRGPILVQLPPSFKYDEQLLESFFDMAAKKAKKLGVSPMTWAFEPRHPTWFDREHIISAYRILARYGVAPVFAQSGKFDGYDPDRGTKTNFIYVRLHGPEDFAASKYAAKLLRPWAERIESWILAGKDVFLYFNNDVHGYAIEDSRILRKLLK